MYKILGHLIQPILRHKKLGMSYRTACESQNRSHGIVRDALPGVNELLLQGLCCKQGILQMVRHLIVLVQMSQVPRRHGQYFTERGSLAHPV